MRITRWGVLVGRVPAGAVLAAVVCVLAGSAGAPARALAAPAAGAPARVFESIAAACAAEGPDKGTPVVVRGYRRAGDGGGGTFRYDPESNLPPDGGAVLALTHAAGRLLRVVSPDEDAFAEWFGAYGDGDRPHPHADQDAINRCLAAYGRVKLRARTYGVRGQPDPYNPAASYRAIDLGPHYHIIGSGRDRTRVKLLDGTNPPGGGAGDNYFILLSNRNFYESADYLVIRDLTVDCNFDAQDKKSTIHAIGIRGGGALVERVNFRGYGTGRHPVSGSSRECFVIHQTLVYKDRKACRRAATYRDLEFTGCGHNGGVGSPVGEITHICLGGADNFDNKGWILPRGKDPDWDPANSGENENNWWPSYGGLVENCVIRDEGYDPATQKSPLNGITYSDCIGLTVRGNRVRNFEGVGVFVMSWWSRDTVIVENGFLGVTTGLALSMVSEGPQLVQCPRHEHVLFAHNRIETGAHKHAQWGTVGVSLYGGEMPSKVRMEGVHVRDNVIAGRAFTNAAGQRSCPLGIKIQILRAAYHDVRIEDNVIDVPDFSAACYVPQEAYSQSLFFYPLALWEDAVRAGHVVYRGNRNRSGKLLFPILADWYMKNAPVWGKPGAR